MTNIELAQVVRDNAVHQWRTLDEIAMDEGRAASELEKAVADHLDEYEQNEVRSFRMTA